MDVTALYTNIPHGDGLQALGVHLERRCDKSIPTDTLLRLTELVLTLNTFEFNGQFFRQCSGVAMGTKMGPSYACLFMGHLEDQIMKAYNGPLPRFFGRYIDDCLIITSMRERNLSKFIGFANSFHPTIKFTFETSPSEIDFLDIKIKLTEDKCLSTSVFYKSTASHSYLDYGSSHSLSTRNNIPFSQFLRLRKLCSDEADFRSQADCMADWFRARHYPEQIIMDALLKASLLQRDSTLVYASREPTKRPIVVVPYHPHNLPLKRIILSNWSLLQQDPIIADAFKEKPMVAYKRPQNTRDILVRSKLRSHTHGQPAATPGTRTCSQNNCKSCPFLDTATIVKGPKTSFAIRRSFSCTSSNIVYVIRCTLCNLLYIGETKRSLVTRVKEHLGYITNKTEQPTGLHFNLPGHSINHFRVQGLWLVNGDNTDRKIIESMLINRLGTKTLFGIH